MRGLRDRMTLLFWGGSICFALLLFLFGGGFVLWQGKLSENRMLAHDQAVAGFLLERGVEERIVAEAFVGSKSGQAVEEGGRLLAAAGYGARRGNLGSERGEMRTDGFVCPDGSGVLLAGLAVFAMVWAGGAWLWAGFQNARLRQARRAVGAFMDGDKSARLPGEAEGELGELFSRINELETSLEAHREAEEEANRFLRGMIQDISHQIKTPLSALSMDMEIIAQAAGEPETVTRFAAKALAALGRIETLVKNLLKMARLDAGAVVMDKQEELVEELAQETRLSFETRAEAEGKRIVLQGQRNTRLDCDRLWMLEAMGNLAKNALDHTREGGRVRICWQETPLTVCIRVEDDGDGIAPGDIHHIFKRFYRSANSRDREGAGLGLPLAKAVVDAHGGIIQAENLPEGGCAFTMLFTKEKVTKM